MADQPAPADSTGPDPIASPPEAAPPAAAPPTVPPTVAPAPADGPARAPVVAQAAAPADAAAQAAGDDAAPSRESVDALLKQANLDGPDSVEGGDGSKNPSIDQLLQQANSEDGAAVASQLPGADAEAFRLPSFQQVMADAQVSSIDLLRDVELNVKIELGRSRMLVEEVLKLAEGSVVELDKLAGDPVDVFVNERLVARGEVLVLNDNFCVRVNEIVAAVKEEGM
ncbi:MAG: flagellar motor switch protein FliN [Tepidisphaeraceae bacterium]